MRRTVAIVEDDRQYARQLELLVRKYAQENGVDLEVKVFHDGMEIAGDYRPVWDIILLDIEMPLLDGMSAAERIREKDQSVIIIFITIMAQYAIRGYSVGALDFVLKPINYYALSMKLRKALRIIDSRGERSVMITVKEETYKLPISSIYYVEVTDHRLVYHTAEGEYTTFGTLKSLEKELGSGFSRCNHCYLVNLKYVDSVQGETVTVSGTPLRVTRAKKKEFMQKLSDYCTYGGR